MIESNKWVEFGLESGIHHFCSPIYFVCGVAFI